MANLPIFNTQDKDLSMLQTRWASVINPLLRNSLNNGTLLTDIVLAVGDNTINHLQGHTLNGYIIAGMQGGFSQIYDKPSPMPKLTLILNSSASVTVSLVVF